MAYLVPPILHLIATPLLLTWLGAETYGVWLILSSLLAIVSLADLGMAAATTLLIARLRRANRHESVLRLASSSWCLYAFFSTFLFLTSFILMPTVLKILRVPPAQLEELRVILPLFSLTLCFQFLNAVPDSVMRGFQRYDLESSIRALVQTFVMGGICLTVFLGGSLNDIVLTHVSVVLLGCIVSIAMASQLLGGMRWLRFRVHRSDLHRLFKLGIFAWVQSLGGAIFNQADKFVVTLLMGPAALPFYNACLQLAQLSSSFLSKTLGFLFPKFAATPADGSQRLRLFNKAMLISTVAACALNIPIFLGAEVILTNWLGLDLPPNLTYVLMILALANALASTGIVPSYLMFGTGNFHISAFFALASGSAITLCAFLLIPPLGLLGVALARLAFLPFSLVSRVIIYHRAFGQGSWLRGFLQLAPVFAGFLLPAAFIIWWPGGASAPPWYFLAAMVTTASIALTFGFCRFFYKY